MKDNVNVATRHTALVRPFMSSILRHAEHRLIDKQENAPRAWDDVDATRLVGVAMRISAEALLDVQYTTDPRYAGEATKAAKRRLADAINYLGMAYDTIDQSSTQPDNEGDTDGKQP
jgi:hypothetical protein